MPMKNHAKYTLIGAAVLVSFAGYLVSYATNVPEPVDWKSGDVIVQDSKVEPVLPVFAIQENGLSHMGVIEVSDEGVIVIEATDKVSATPLKEFIGRGVADGYSVWRGKNLTDEQRQQVAAAARAQLGKPSDFFLERGTAGLYSSELVQLAFSAIGVTLGQPQRLSTIPGDMSKVLSRFNAKWSENLSCKRRYLEYDQCWQNVSRQEVITPTSIVADDRLEQIYATRAVLARIAQAAERKPAPPPSLRP